MSNLIVKTLYAVAPQYASRGIRAGKIARAFYGLDGDAVVYISGGTWSDGFIGYRGLAIDEHYILDALYDMYAEECELKGIADDVDGFDAWMFAHNELIIEYLDCFINDNWDEIVAAVGADYMEVVAGA